MMWWLPHIILVLWNLGNAWHDARRIKKDKKVYHGYNLIAYGVLVFIAGLSLHIKGWDWVALCAAGICCRYTVFNPALSIFRGKKWYYVSPERKAFTDKVMYRLFGADGKKPVVISGILWAITIIIDGIW